MSTKESIDDAIKDEAVASYAHVAYCRYVTYKVDFDGAEHKTIETCDSDAKGAFKVYRAYKETENGQDKPKGKK